MVFVRVSETYDLSTKVNKMGIVGIHTPNNDLVSRQWKGLFMNYAKFRYVSCDVALACASILPADPLQVGVEAGSIAPQDMFNPILYKAVSNDSMNTFVQFLYGQDLVRSEGVSALTKGSVIDVHDTTFKSGNTDIDQFNMYYGILSNSDGFKKAMPQAGLSMEGLYPLVFERLSNVGYTGFANGENGRVPSLNSGGTFNNLVTGYAKSLRGNAKRMPSIPTTYYVGSNAESNVDGSIAHTMDGSDIPPAYVGLIILPPAKLNQLYYRLKVTWNIEFTDLRAISDISGWGLLSTIGDISYGTDYASQASKMSVTTSMVDTDGADIQKIMEGSS